MLGIVLGKSSLEKQKGYAVSSKPLVLMAGPMRLELATSGLTGHRTRTDMMSARHWSIQSLAWARKRCAAGGGWLDHSLEPSVNESARQRQSPIKESQVRKDISPRPYYFEISGKNLTSVKIIGLSWKKSAGDDLTCIWGSWTTWMDWWTDRAVIVQDRRIHLLQRGKDDEQGKIKTWYKADEGEGKTQ